MHSLLWKTTKDGSETIYHPLVGESYKSSHAAATESDTIYIQKGVQEHSFWLENSNNFLNVLELGFGIGTNFIGIKNFALKQGKKISFTSIDNNLEAANFSLSKNENTILKTLLKEKLFQENTFNAKLLETNFHNALPSFANETFHSIFFDPFSPKSNPEVWQKNIFQECFRILKPSGRLVTYSVSRIAKDGLIAAGFTIQKFPLPEILHKRSALLAVKHG